MSENQSKELAAVELMKVMLGELKGHGKGGYEEERKQEVFALYRECLAVVKGEG